MFDPMRNRSLLLFILLLSFALAVCGLDHAGTMGQGGSASMNCDANSCTTLVSVDASSPVHGAGFLLIIALLALPGSPAFLGLQSLFLRPLFDSGGRSSASTDKLYRLHSVFRL
jgi:hypothetical protein